MQLRMSLTEGAGYVFAWPALCARGAGYYEREGYEVEFVTGTETVATDGLLSGDVPLARRSGDAHLELIDAGAPVRVIAGIVGKAPLHLFAQPALRSFEALRDRPLAGTQAPNTGAMMLRMVLTDHGLTDGSYTMRDVGRAANRFTALQAGDVAAALLSPPASAQAERAGFVRLSAGPDDYPRFPYSLLEVNTLFADRHRAEIVAVLRAEIDGMRWLHDPVNRIPAIAVLADAAGLSVDDAELCYGEAIERDRWFERDLGIDAERLGLLVDALRRYTNSPPAQDPSAYLDLGYLDEARAGRATE
jgi:ABC-type nitrate/sulfonate/bicarbonate transport system substrate-binding protein